MGKQKKTTIEVQGAAITVFSQTDEDFIRLKNDESRRLSLAWNLNRTLSKLNYRIHTDAIKTHLIPPKITPFQAALTYATDANPKLEGNMPEYATVEFL